MSQLSCQLAQIASDVEEETVQKLEFLCWDEQIPCQALLTFGKIAKKTAEEPNITTVVKENLGLKEYQYFVHSFMFQLFYLCTGKICTSLFHSFENESSFTL